MQQLLAALSNRANRAYEQLGETRRRYLFNKSPSSSPSWGSYPNFATDDGFENEGSASAQQEKGGAWGRYEEKVHRPMVRMYQYQVPHNTVVRGGGGGGGRMGDLSTQSTLSSV